LTAVKSKAISRFHSPLFYIPGEGDAYGANLRQIYSRPRARAAVSLRASTCVDCHVIKLKDLEDVMSSYPDQRTELLEMMDAADNNDLYEEVLYNEPCFLLCCSIQPLAFNWAVLMPG